MPWSRGEMAARAAKELRDEIAAGVTLGNVLEKTSAKLVVDGVAA